MNDINPRTCIVTREEKSPEELLRFVLDADANLVPDLKRKLPGRGAWVSLERKVLEMAVKKNSFSKAFKQPVVCGVELGGMVEQLLERDVLGILSLARKAGQAVTGFMKVENSIRVGDISVLVHAREASEDGKSKLMQLLNAFEMDDVTIVDFLSGEALDRHLGNDNTVHVALLKGGLAKNFKTATGRLASFRGG